MTSIEICEKLVQHFAERIIGSHPQGKHPRIEINASDWLEVAAFLKNDPALRFDWLSNLGGLDYAADNRMAIEVDLWSYELKHRFAVKVFCDRQSPTIPSVSGLWAAANWQEREIADLLGIVFTSHPDPRRILLADDWSGHPLRKDYEFPREVNGIPGSVELDWQQKRS